MSHVEHDGETRECPDHGSRSPDVLECPDCPDGEG